ncbi:MAG: hypothetical protein WDO16_17105 [Bacteroidota bacterium]
MYDKNNKLVSATELKRESLHSSYNTEDTYAPVLLELLGIDNPDLELGLTDEQKQALHLGRALMEEGITQAEVAEIIGLLEARKQQAAAKQQGGKSKESKESISVEEEEIKQTLAALKNDIKKKKQAAAKKGEGQTSVEKEEETAPLELTADEDEYTKPSVDLQKKIEKLKEETEAQIENHTRIEKLNEIVKDSRKYSFIWFKALLELECLGSFDANAQESLYPYSLPKWRKRPY